MSSIKALLLCATGIWSGIAVMADQALLTVPRNDEPVTIDGVLNDQAWKKAPGAILIPNWQETGRQFEDGCFQITYDQKNIYIGGVLEQSFLEPAANKLDLVKNKAQSDNDSRIYNDDVVEVFIQIPESPEYWHLAVNSDGRIFRSKGTGYGQSRPQPACGIAVKSVRMERTWSFELAIPLELLGMSSIKNGTMLALDVFRNNNPKSEITAWNPSLPNFHQPLQWGELVLKDTAPAVQGISLRSGRENIEFGLRLNQGKYRFAGVLNAVPMEVKKSPRTLALQGKADVAGGIVQLSVLDENTGKTLWRSPQQKISMTAATGKMDLKIPGSFKIFVNGELFADGRNEIVRDFVLPGKINTVGIEVDGDNRPFKGFLQLGRLKIDADKWLISNKAGSNWLNTDYDVSGWPLYAGQPISGKNYFRFTVVRNYTLFAPQRPDGKLYLANNVVDAWALRIGSPVSYTLPDYELNIAVPEALDIPRYDFDQRVYSRYKHTLNNQVESGRRILNFKFKQPMPQLAYNWGFNVVNFLVRPDFPQSAGNEEIPVQVWQCGRGLAEYPQEYQLHILPELKSGKLNKIVVNLWDVERGNCFTLDEMNLMFDTFAGAGINYAGISETRKPDDDLAMNRRAHESGMKSIFAHYGNHSLFLLERLKEKPEYRIDNPVYPRPAWNPGMCPLVFLSDPWVRKYFEKMFPHFDVFLDDVERGIHGNCLCEHCRQEMAKRFQWAEVPDAKTIYLKYQKELVEFQIDLNRRMIDYQQGLSRDINPKIKSAVYSGYDSTETKKNYGVDWSRFRDVDYPSAGYSLNGEPVRNTRKALNEKSIICGYIMDSAQYEKPMAQQNIKAVLFHQLRNSGFGGVLVWMWRELDGRGYHALADFTRGAAAFEPFLSEANLINQDGICSGMPKEAVSVYKWKGQYLILAVNMQTTSKKLQVKLPDRVPQAEVVDFYRGQTRVVENGFSADIPAADVGLILIKPQSKNN